MRTLAAFITGVMLVIALTSGGEIVQGQATPGTMWKIGPTTLAVETEYPIQNIQATSGTSMYPWSGAAVAYTDTPISELKIGDFVIVDWTAALGTPTLMHHAVYSVTQKENGEWEATTIGWNNGWQDFVKVTKDNYVGKTEVLWKK